MTKTTKEIVFNYNAKKDFNKFNKNVRKFVEMALFLMINVMILIQKMEMDVMKNAKLRKIIYANITKYSKNQNVFLIFKPKYPPNKTTS